MGTPPPYQPRVLSNITQTSHFQSTDTLLVPCVYVCSMMRPSERIMWALGLLEANGGGVRKAYFRDKCSALGAMKYSGFYSFLSELRGFEWVLEKTHKDGCPWIFLTPSGLEQLQALRAAKA